MKRVVKERKNHTKHLSTEEIKNYLDLNLKNREMYLIERHLLDCQLCQEALEGYEGADFIHQQLEDLKGRLVARATAGETVKKSGAGIKYGIAAAIAVILGSVYFVLNTRIGGEELAQKAEPAGEESAIIYDSDTAAGESAIALAEAPVEEEVNEERPPLQTRRTEEQAPRPSRQDTQPVVTEETSTATPSIVADSEPAAAFQTSATAGAGGEVAAGDAEEELTVDLLAEVADEEVEEAPVDDEVKLVEPSAEEELAFQSLPTQEARQRVAVTTERDLVNENPVESAAKKSVESQEPRPNNGLSAYIAGLEERIQYPQEALDNQIEGEVKIRFTVTIYGGLEGLEVTGSLGYGCDEEALRVVQQGPNWLPAREEGIPVPAMAEISIPFQLEP